MTNQINIAGVSVPLKEIEDDLEAAVAKGFNHDFAFTVHTVRGLIEEIKRLNKVKRNSFKKRK